MSYFFATITLFFLLPFILSVVYYYLLLLVYLFIKMKKDKRSLPDVLLRYIIVIPAHNEEMCIEETIRSCQEIDYPQDLYQIFVIADNCSDCTAEVARKCGAEVIERWDDNLRGKGHALEYAFNHLCDKPCDAFLVIDADCEVNRSVFCLASSSLKNGEKVIQFEYSVGNPDDSAMTYALAVGNFIENQFFYAPKSLLKLAVFLRGTGMVIARSVLEEYRWSAHTVGEDTEYSVTLFRNGIRVSFIHAAGVVSPFPVDNNQLDVQRTRWAAGNLGYGRKEALNLIYDGLRRKDWLLLDAGVTFFLTSKPLLFLAAIMSLLGAFVCFLSSPQYITLLYAALLIFSMLLLYFLCAIIAFGVTRKRIVFLCQVPKIILRLVLVTLRGALKSPSISWHKTPR